MDDLGSEADEMVEDPDGQSEGEEEGGGGVKGELESHDVDHSSSMVLLGAGEGLSRVRGDNNHLVACFPASMKVEARAQSADHQRRGRVGRRLTLIL